jgi:transposase-like protein
MRRRDDRDRQAVLELLRRGASGVEAAAATGVPVNTVRAWIRRYPEFRTARKPALTAIEGQAGLPDRQELLELLAEQARAGSTTAAVQLLKELPAQATEDVRARTREIMASPGAQPS